MKKIKWFKFDEIKPPHGMNIIAINCRNEIAIFKWDSDISEGEFVDSFTSCWRSDREIYDFEAWIPVDYFPYPATSFSDPDKIKKSDNILFHNTPEIETIISEIKSKTTALQKMSKEERFKIIILPNGSQLQGDYLLHEISNLYNKIKDIANRIKNPKGMGIQGNSQENSTCKK